MSRTWRLLLVDDSPDDRLETRRLLLLGSEHRFKFTEVDSGAAALLWVRENGPPDAIVLDYNLPDMNGDLVLDALVDADGLTPCPVVVLTGGDSANGTELLRRGAQDFIGKAWISPPGLCRALENAADRWAMAGELRMRQRALAASERSARQQALHLHSIYEAAPIGLAFVDRALRIESLNPTFLALGSDEVRGLEGAHLSALGSESGERLAQLCRDCMETGEAVLDQPVTGGGPLPDAQRHWLASFTPVRDADQRVVGAIAMAREVTAQRRAELVAARSQETLAMALAASGAGAWSWDLVGGVGIWSEENFALYGIDPALGAPDYARWLEHVHPDDRQATRAALTATLKGSGLVYATEYRVHHPARGLRWLMVMGRVVRGDDGRAVRLMGINIDITERRQMEAQLLAQDRRKDEFIAMLAHELRNPLAPLRNGLEVIKRAADQPATIVRVRAMMERQVSQLVRLIDDLMDLSRVRQGKVSLQRERMDLRLAVDQAVETCRPMVQSRRHQLDVLRGDLPLWIDGDAARLSQVLCNLLVNAAKYTPEGGRVEVAAVATEGQAVVSVSDNGLGIPQAMLAEVFDLFAQVTSSLGQSQGGLGIGLSLVRSLVELHEGTIEVHSDGPGLGSRFTVRLPLVASAPAAIDGPGAAVVAAPTAPTAQRRRILVIDDNIDSADSLATLLAIAGHETRTAYDGAAAIASVDDFAPQVVFLDLGLPDMSGYEVARRIRLRQAGAAKPLLVALTGFASGDDREKTLQAGFDLHLCKPVEPALVNAVLTRMESADAGWTRVSP